MDEPNLIVPAIFVFVMLLIGLGLTIREYRAMAHEDRKHRD